MLTRRQLLQYGIGAGAALAAPWAVTRTASAAMGGKLTKYATKLPVLGDGIIVKSGAGPQAFSLTQIAKTLHPQLPPTPLWAYSDGSDLAGQAGSFGMAIVAMQGTPLQISYTHALPVSYPTWIPVDTKVAMYGAQTRFMTHLHGGLVLGGDDGNPTATPDLYGPGSPLGLTQTANYPNSQPASLVWFHDHGLGTTRLNVFAGLAGAYIIRDGFDTGDPATQPASAKWLPTLPYEIPLVVQDRQFNPDGTFLYPTSALPNVTWIGEYFGDVMLVNGMVWPYLNVEPRMYRFRALNGCNARILDLNFGGATMWQIGAEGGLFAAPVPIKALVMAPGERADVLVDFGPMAGQTLAVENTNPPLPVVTPAPSLSPVMQINVAPGTRVKPTLPTTIEGGQDARIAWTDPPKKRFFALNEVAPGTVNWRVLINEYGFMDYLDNTAPPEPAITPGEVQDWYYINLTADTHPMHTHLVSFQVVGRYKLDTVGYQNACKATPGATRTDPASGTLIYGGIDPTNYMSATPLPADPTERGFKDTVRANPGYVTVIRARFNLPAGATGAQSYVHHCHIVEHEDNDMMLPFTVGTN